MISYRKLKRTIKIDRKFIHRIPHLTADICKTVIGRGLEIVLMERAVNFT